MNRSEREQEEDYIVSNLYSANYPMVNVADDGVTVMYSGPNRNIQTTMKMAHETWKRVEERVKIRKSFDNFNDLRNLVGILVSTMSIDKIASQLNAAKNRKDSLFISDKIMTKINVPPMVLMEALIEYERKRKAFDRHFGPNED